MMNHPLMIALLLMQTSALSTSQPTKVPFMVFLLPFHSCTNLSSHREKTAEKSTHKHSHAHMHEEMLCCSWLPIEKKKLRFS